MSSGATLLQTRNAQHPTSVHNLHVVRHIVEAVLNKGDLAVADELMAPDFVEHNPRPGQGPGREGFKQRIRMLRTAFPDLHYGIEDELAADDRVVLRLMARGTHRGKLAGLAPTRKSFTMAGMVLFRVVDGKVVERWATYDNLSMLQQLGVVPVWGRLSG